MRASNSALHRSNAQVGRGGVTGELPAHLMLCRAPARQARTRNSHGIGPPRPLVVKHEVAASLRAGWRTRVGSDLIKNGTLITFIKNGDQCGLRIYQSRLERQQ